MVQSAGNQKNLKKIELGSSETIRENTYDLFRNSYKHFYNMNIEIDDEWLNWFVGFVEGDGAILGKRGRTELVITQKDIQVLLKIKEKLNMGRITYHYSDNKSSKDYFKDKTVKYGRFIISDSYDLLLIYLMFNGNLKLKHRKLQLKVWYENLKIKCKISNLNLVENFNIKEIPKLILDNKKITLNDAWLSGFTDAEGCFSLKISKTSKGYYVGILFILDQKDELEILNEISMLFINNNSVPAHRAAGAAKIRKTKNGEMYRIQISCNDINKLNYKRVMNYFNRFRLKTTKQKSFLIWKEVIGITLGNQPLDNKQITYIRELRRNINKYIINNNPIGKSNKS